MSARKRKQDQDPEEDEEELQALPSDEEEEEEECVVTLSSLFFFLRFEPFLYGFFDCCVIAPQSREYSTPLPPPFCSPFACPAFRYAVIASVSFLVLFGYSLCDYFTPTIDLALAFAFVWALKKPRHKQINCLLAFENMALPCQLSMLLTDASFPSYSYVDSDDPEDEEEDEEDDEDVADSGKRETANQPFRKKEKEHLPSFVPSLHHPQLTPSPLPQKIAPKAKKQKTGPTPSAGKVNDEDDEEEEDDDEDEEEAGDEDDEEGDPEDEEDGDEAPEGEDEDGEGETTAPATTKTTTATTKLGEAAVNANANGSARKEVVVPKVADVVEAEDDD